MLRLLADENFNSRIIRGLLRRQPEMDVVRVQDVGLSGADDCLVLAWAAHEGRVLLTHDQKTVPTYAYERVMAGLPMPGVFIADTYVPVQQAIEDIVLLVECSQEHEWEGQVRYLPL
jgi:Domain of unknown function (DUF5615)